MPPLVYNTVITERQQKQVSGLYLSIYMSIVFIFLLYIYIYIYIYKYIYIYIIYILYIYIWLNEEAWYANQSFMLFKQSPGIYFIYLFSKKQKEKSNKIRHTSYK